MNSDNPLRRYLSCALRTRSYVGIPQRIEIGGCVSNAITTVTKDYLLLEITQTHENDTIIPPISDNRQTRCDSEPDTERTRRGENLSPNGHSPDGNGEPRKGSHHIDVALLNGDNGMCRTIKAQYASNSAANFIRQDGFGASAVIELWTV